MKNSPAIRLAAAADAAAIREIYRPFVEHSAVSFELECPAVEEIVQRIEQAQQRHAWLVCEWRGQVLGYAYAGPYRSRTAYDWGCEVSVYVAESFRKKGVARSLYSALLDVLTWQGYCVALAGMTLPNEASAGFHKAMGFRPFALYEKIGFKNGRWHATEWWRKELRPGDSEPKTLKPVLQLQGGAEWRTLCSTAVAQLEVS